MNYLNYAQRSIIPSVFYTARINIPNLSLTQTNEILRTGSTAHLNNSDILTILNTKQAWDYLCDHPLDPLHWTTISQYHKILSAQLFSDAGTLRTAEQALPKTSKTPKTTYIPPVPTEESVEAQLHEALEEHNPVQRAMTLFALMCKYHWFKHNTMLTAAIVANHALIQDNAGVFLLSDDILKQAFHTQLTHYYDANDLSAFTAWLCDKAVIR